MIWSLVCLDINATSIGLISSFVLSSFQCEHVFVTSFQFSSCLSLYVFYSRWLRRNFSRPIFCSEKLQCRLPRSTQSSNLRGTLKFVSAFGLSSSNTAMVGVDCGRLSWLPVSFLLHVKHTLSYRIVDCSSLHVDCRPSGLARSDGWQWQWPEPWSHRRQFKVC